MSGLAWRRSPAERPQALHGYQMRSQPQNGLRFDFFKSRQNSNLFKPFDSGSRWSQISRSVVMAFNTLTKKIDWGHFRTDFWDERSGGNAAPVGFFGLQSSINPLANFLSKCVENSRNFIFRKNKPRALSYFKMSKKTRLEPILSSKT